MRRQDTKFRFQRLIQLTRIHHPTNINVISAGVKDLGKAGASVGQAAQPFSLPFLEEDDKPSHLQSTIWKSTKSLVLLDHFPRNHRFDSHSLHPTRSVHSSILLAHRMHSLRFTIQACHSTQLSRTRNKNLFHLIPWDPPDLWRPKAETCRHLPPGHFRVSPLAVSFLPRGCFRSRIIYP